MDFISFDLETTGTVPGVDRIVEIGAVKFSNGTPVESFSTLIDPGMPIPEGASRVNGIFDDMVKGQPTIDTILEPFAEFCGETPLVAHNAPFDTQFLVNDILKHETYAPAGVVLDSLPMARKVFPGLANYRLGTLTDHLGIPSGQFHRAEEDASYCGYLLLKIIERITTPGQPCDLENLVLLTGKPEFKFPVVDRSYKQLNLLGEL